MTGPRALGLPGVIVTPTSTPSARRVQNVIGGVCGALVLTETIWLLLARPGAALASDVIAVILASCAAASCVVAGRWYPGRLRRLWTLMAATMVLAAAGRIVWTVGRVTIQDGLPNNPLVGIFFIAGMVCGTAAILSSPSAPASAVGRVRAVLDGIIGALSLIPIGWVVVFGDVSASSLSDPVRVLALVFPMVDLAQLAVLVAVLGRARPMWRPLGLIGFSLAVRVVADTIYVSQNAQGHYFPGHPIDVLWPLSYLLLIMATGYPPSGVSEPGAEVTPRLVARWRLTLPYLLVGGAIVATLLTWQRYGRTPQIVFFTVLALLAALAIRQSLAADEDGRLATRLHRLAYEDTLTGLPNRLLFARRLQAAIDHRRPVSVLLLDLDGFKQVNDRFGHAAGDAMLATVAERMRRAVAGQALIARMGGDEFAVLVDPERAGPAQTLAQRVLAELSPATWDGVSGARCSASIGIASFEPHHTGHSDLLRDADIAMYAAKAAGKSAFQICTPALRQAAMTRAELSADLRRAVDAGDQLELVFQPIVDLTTGWVCSAEALLRWRHPHRGLLTPDLFLPLAEEAGLTARMDRWVLDEACRAAAAWREVAPRMTVAVNVAPTHLRRVDIAEAVIAATATAGIAPDMLTVELTESALIEGTDDVLRRLHQLRKTGVRIAIDDFGTGYSSLSYLHRIPATELKIDSSFVARIGEDDRATAMIAMIARLARDFELVVVAEGIETLRQHRAVTGAGYRRGQGYLYGRPCSLDALIESVRPHRPALDAAVTG